MPPLALLLPLPLLLLLAAPSAAQQVYAGGSSEGAPTAAAGLPRGFADAVFVAGLVAPMSMTFARDGRLFVSLKAGDLVVVTAAGALLPTPFVSVAPSLGQDSEGRMGDGGLFSCAFDPFDPEDAFVYVQWLHAGDNGPGKPWVGDFTRISRFTADPANRNVALAGSEVVVFDHSVLRPGTVFHFGGSLLFLQDGYLLTSHGDYYFTYSQTLDNSLGKVSRIHKNGTIPADGPFYASGSGLGRAALFIGLRNPFSATVSPASLGATRTPILVVDVGEEAFEEINAVVSGGNGGWPRTEGYRAGAVAPQPAGDAGAYVDPLFAYDHGTQPGLGPNLPAACCITGGVACDSTSFPPAWLGRIFITDLCGGWIAALPPAGSAPGGAKPVPELFARGYNTPQSLVFGPLDGALYVIAHNDGSVHRIAYAPLAAPAVSAQPASARTPLGESATFSVSVASAAAVIYQWQSAAPGSEVYASLASSSAGPTYTTAPATLADDGTRFRVSATSSNGYAMSAAATWAVLNNQPPLALIDSPPMLQKAGLAYSSGSAGAYVAGASFVFAAHGVDNTSPRGPAPIPAADISFDVFLLHNAHRHDFIIDSRGTSVTVVTPLKTEFAPAQAYLVVCTVTDANGVAASASSFIYPVLATVTISSSPAGAVVLVNNAEHVTPYALTTVAGLTVLLAPAPADRAAFLGWADQLPLNNDATSPQREFVLPQGPSALVLMLAPPPPGAMAAATPSAPAQPSTLAPMATSAALGDAAELRRSSSGAAPAQLVSTLGVLARLALAVFAAEAVRRFM